jgi:hypothetical protein
MNYVKKIACLAMEFHMASCGGQTQMLQSIDRDLGHAEYPFVTNLHDQKMPLRCQ